MRSQKKHRGLIDLRGGSRAKAPEVASRRAPELGVVRFRRSPLRTKRRKKQVYIALGVLLGVAAAGYGLHTASYTEPLTIRTIEIEGASELSPELVRTYVESVLEDGSYHLVARDNIFTYPRGVIERAVASYFPRIRSVQVSRDSLLAQAVTVTIVEREPYATWCAEVQMDDRECYFFDDTGFIFADTALSRVSPRTHYVFTGGVEDTDAPIGGHVGGTHIERYIALLSRLESEGYGPLGVRVVDERDFEIPLESGYLLKASHGADPNKLVHDLELVLSSEALAGKSAEIEYVDLRFGNRVYYKLRSDSEPARASEEE